MQTSNNQQQYKIRINQFIRVPQVRVILSNGENGGIIDTKEALKLAQIENLDLVEINPKSSPPVVRIVDFGKMQYEEKKKAKSAKRSQMVQELKELTFKPNIAEHDLSHKIAQARTFLLNGSKLKLTVKFRGREIMHSELGRSKLEYVFQQLKDLIQEIPPVSLEGKLMSVVVNPAKKQA
jgi:translation initiation factor IF-3